MAFVTIGNARSDAEGAGFEQRILHAGHLLLHGLQRFANDGRAHTFGAQVTNLFKLEEVVEGKRLGNRSKSGALPANELLGRDVQYPKDVRSTISIHVSSESPAELIPIIGGWQLRKQVQNH